MASLLETMYLRNIFLNLFLPSCEKTTAQSWIGKKQFREIIEEDDDVILVWISVLFLLGRGWERGKLEALQEAGEMPGVQLAWTDLRRQEGARRCQKSESVSYWGNRMPKTPQAWCEASFTLSHGGSGTRGQVPRFRGPCYAHLSKEGVQVPLKL